MNKNRIIFNNKKAFFNYFFLKEFECGISLAGTEIKSIRENPSSFDLSDSYVRVVDNELILIGSRIPIYKNGNIYNHKTDRDRVLLMKKKDIFKVKQQVKEKNITIVPVKAYWFKNFVKIEIALAKGKKLYDKRKIIKEREVDLKIQKESKI